VGDGLAAPLERSPGPEGASFSSAVAASGTGTWIHVAGQLSPGGGLAEQAARCFDLIEEALAGQGASLRDVVRITAYLTSLDDFAEYARVRGERFGDALPASTAVQVAGLLHGALIEIDAVAFIAV
jgi:2-iminobutanoate/2-iminopropanoate deaminase